MIRSIDEAAKKGKIKIEAINDYTAQEVEIEIKLPRGQYAEEFIRALYAYTECEVSITSQIVVIKDNLPWEPNVREILEYHVERLQEYLKRELEIERDRLQEKIFCKSLEQIFIENRLYKNIEHMRSYQAVHQAISDGLIPFHGELQRVPGEEDRERLLSIPIRRISRFDIDKNQAEIAALRTALEAAEKHLKQVKKYTINHIKQLLKGYGAQYPRKTKVESIGEIDRRAIETRTIKVGFDPDTGFLGTKVTGPQLFECTNFDKLLLFFKDGSYSVISIPEKQYAMREGQKLMHVGIADKKTVFSVVYKDPKTLFAYAKRFVIEKYITDKIYRYIDEGACFELLTDLPHPKVHVMFVPKVKQKQSQMEFDLTGVLIKGVTARGVRITNRAIKKIVPFK